MIDQLNSLTSEKLFILADPSRAALFLLIVGCERVRAPLLVGAYRQLHQQFRRQRSAQVRLREILARIRDNTRPRAPKKGGLGCGGCGLHRQATTKRIPADWRRL